MTEAELKNEIKNGLSGVYLFAGEEEYLKRHYLLAIRSAVLEDESFSSFNHTVINYLDGGFGNLADAVAMSPFMQPMRLNELSGFNYNSAKEPQLKALASIVADAQANDECVLVLYADTDLFDVSKGSKVQKKVNAALGDGVKTVIFEKTTPAKLAVWIRRHFEHEGLGISDADCQFMIERCGRSMQMLSGEIDKLSAYKKSKGETIVARSDIEYICIKNEEIGAFALANAVLDSDTSEIFRVLGEYKRSDTDLKPKAILSSVSSVYATLISVKLLFESGENELSISKKLGVHEYKVKLYLRTAKGLPVPKLERALALCIDADSDMKLGFLDFISLERLLCSISNECRR